MHRARPSHPRDEGRRGAPRMAAAAASVDGTPGVRRGRQKTESPGSFSYLPCRAGTLLLDGCGQCPNQTNVSAASGAANTALFALKCHVGGELVPPDQVHYLHLLLNPQNLDLIRRDKFAAHM